MKLRFSTVVLCLATTLSLPALAQDKANEADARKQLQNFVDTFKAKGVKGAADQINGGDCPKDMGCLVADDTALVIGSRTKAMIGQQMPDMMDVDGVNVSQALIGPLKAGKTTWEASYKLNPPGSKAIVPRKSVCAKLDAKHFACTTYSL